MIEEHRRKITEVKDSIDVAFDMIEDIFESTYALPEELNNSTLRPTEVITRIERDEHGDIITRQKMVAIEASASRATSGDGSQDDRNGEDQTLFLIPA